MGRLPDRVVLCANLGYLPDGRVAVAGRPASRNLHTPNPLRAAFARTGHTPLVHSVHGRLQASSGHLSRAEYAVLL